MTSPGIEPTTLRLVARVHIIFPSLRFSFRIGVEFTSNSLTQRVAFSGRFHVLILMVTLSTSREHFQLLEDF
jgi:hypothetical protein